MLMYRNDEMGLAFQCSAQTPNMHVNGAITVNLLCFRPRQSEQLLAREYLAEMFCEDYEQATFLWFER